jgi:hypothetical protein
MSTTWSKEEQRRIAEKVGGIGGKLGIASD